EIVLVENGREVLDVLAKENFDLILMDCHMPEMDGYLTTQVIRQKAGLKDLPIIAMTASAMVDERDRCFQVGMNDYISKPLNFMTVRDVLKKYGKLAQG
ncbi:MAG TPA: response regulator, partial [Bdellovibrio sp.]|uniref:response regulator n=1 Tax=Bdellovibrio sp. TaxID=28201 RepID=UPI002EE2842E